MQRITTFLTFDDRAEEAIDFYTSIFENSRILSSTRYGDAGQGPKVHSFPPPSSSTASGSWR